MGISTVDLTTITRWRRIAVDAAIPFQSEWKENREFYFGIQWDPAELENLPLWRSAPVVNLIFPICEQAHALLTDQRPIAYAYRQRGGTARMENILTSLLEQIWTTANVEDVAARFQKDRIMDGTGIIKIGWNKKDKKRSIPIDVKRIAPDDFYLDPLAEDVKDARYVFEHDEMPLAELLEQFPDKYEDIKSSNHADLEGTIDNDGIVFDVPKISVWDVWFKDTTLVEEVEPGDKDGEEKIKKSMRKYPSGRHVKYIGDVVLVDEKNPYDWFPYIACPLVKVPSEFWGLSLITPLKPVQIEINKIEADILDNIKVNTHPMWIASEGSVDLEEFVAAPSTLVELRGGIDSKLDRLPGIQMPPEVFNMEQKKINDLFRLSGVNDVTFGNVVGSSRPNAVKQNYEASITRIREYTRLSNRALSELGEKMIDLIQKFLPANTIVSISSPDDDISNLFDPVQQKEVYDAFQKESVQNQMRFRDVTLNQANDEFSQTFQQMTGVAGMTEEKAREALQRDNIDEFKNSVKDGRYGYKVDIHPIKAHDKQYILEMVGILMQYGYGDLISGEVILDMLDIPDKDKIMAKSRRDKAAMAQQQPQQPQGGQQNGQNK